MGRSCRRWKSQSASLLAGLALCTALVVALADPAAATTCTASGGNPGNPGHYYIGEQGDSYVYEGIFGQLPTDSLGIGNAHFEIAWNDLGTNSSDCRNGSLTGQACWIQTGYGWGIVGGHSCNCLSIQSYMEEEDINNYDVNWTAGGYAIGTDNQSYVAFSGTTDSHSNGRVDAYVNVGNSTNVLTGAAWFSYPNYDFMLPYGYFESEYTSTGNCGSVPAYQYFGALHDGTFNSLTYQYVTAEYPYNWLAWDTNNTQKAAWANSPYSAQNLGSGNRAGYRGSGS